MLTRQEIAKMTNSALVSNGSDPLPVEFFEKPFSSLGRAHVIGGVPVKIGFNTVLLQAPPQVTTQVILHEVAHILAIPHRDRGHGRFWRQKARQLGIRAERCLSLKEVWPEGEKLVLLRHPWLGYCAECKKLIDARQRLSESIKTSSSYHQACGPQGVLKWVKNTRRTVS